MDTANNKNQTRETLIEAAGQIFAEFGYEATTIRQITVKAQANVAAVNYHFGDKLELYRAVITDVMTARSRLLAEQCAHGTPKARLRRFIEWMLPSGDGEHDSWKRALVVREISLIQQSKSTDLVPDLIRPVHQILGSIVRDLMGGGVSASDVEVTAHLVAALCTHWLHHSSLTQELSPTLILGTGQMDGVVEHIYQFALAGVQRISRLSKRAPEPNQD